MPDFNFKFIRMIQNNKSSNKINNLKLLIDDLYILYQEHVKNQNTNFIKSFDKLEQIYSEYNNLITNLQDKPFYTSDNNALSNDTINEYRTKICNILKSFLTFFNEKLNKAEEQLKNINIKLSSIEETDINYNKYKDNYNQWKAFKENIENAIARINKYYDFFTNNQIKIQVYKYPNYNEKIMTSINDLITKLHNTNDFKLFEDIEQQLFTIISDTPIEIAKIHMEKIINAIRYNKEMFLNNIKNDIKNNIDDMTLLKNNLLIIFQEQAINDIAKYDKKLFKECLFKKSIPSANILRDFEFAFTKLYSSIKINTWYNAYYNDPTITANISYQGKKTLYEILTKMIQDFNTDIQQLTNKINNEENEKLQEVDPYKGIIYLIIYWYIYNYYNRSIINIY